MPGVPDHHSAAEDAAFIKAALLPGHTVWVAELEGARVGMAAWRDDWLTHLYVHPAYHRRGIGDALLSEAKLQHPKGLQLWVFQSNTPARAFYEARGFRCVELTDGRANEEGCPDARYIWSGKN
jgi:ribosomal protein S18 acetylase RimI-like enzyme